MTSRIPAIDLLRGVAILLVVHHHVTSKFVALEWRLAHPWIAAIPTHGFYGVNLFFVLSGFVLFLPWKARDAAGVATPTAGAFYARRARRILPLYYLSIAVAFALWVGWSRPPRGAWWHLGMVGSFAFQFSELHFFPRFNAVLWSLGVEVSFSLLLPVLAAVALRWGVLRLTGLVVAFAAAVRFFGSSGYPSLPLIEGIGGRLDDFVVGMAAAAVFVASEPSRKPWAWIAIGLVLCEVACVASTIWASEGRWTVRAVVVPCLLDAGVFALLRGVLAPTIAVGVRPLQLVGRMSYSIYLWHVLVLDRLFGAAGAGSAADLVLYAVVLLTVSSVTYRYVELRLAAAPARRGTSPR